MNEEYEELSFRLEVFEGPLDLLLSLISKNKVSIYDIPISLIFDQYMEYIERMREMNMDIAGEFLDMASRLMLIKSKMLLPKNEAEKAEDPRRDLVDALLEYRKAKLEAVKLREMFDIHQGRFIKETDEVGVDRTYVCDHTVDMLTRAFEKMELRIKLESENRSDIPIKTLNAILTKKVTSVPEKSFFILRYLFKRKEGCSFSELLLTNRTRSELIASFMAILSLVRSGRIECVGEEDDPIIKIRERENIYAAADRS